VGGANAGNFDAFLVKHDEAGSQQWARQWGTSSLESPQDVCTDSSGNVFVTGSTEGQLGAEHAGSRDVFLTKFNAAGNLIWTRQWGTNQNDIGWSIAADQLDNVYVSGSTSNNPGGGAITAHDSFVLKFDSAGELAWQFRRDVATIDSGSGIAVDSVGNVYLAGAVNQDPGRQFYDGYLLKLRQVPEPAGQRMVLIGLGPIFLFLAIKKRGWGKDVQPENAG
jgi:hypothetical protein